MNWESKLIAKEKTKLVNVTTQLEKHLVDWINAKVKKYGSNRSEIVKLILVAAMEQDLKESNHGQ